MKSYCMQPISKMRGETIPYFDYESYSQRPKNILKRKNRMAQQQHTPKNMKNQFISVFWMIKCFILHF